MDYILYGSPHSLPTYKVALMLRLSAVSFQFRYVSFQKEQHKTAEFRALSRWGQVPVLTIDGQPYFQSAAIVEYLSETLGTFGGTNARNRQTIREWMFWNSDVLTPPVFACYGVRLGEQKLLPIDVDPTLARYHRQRAEDALNILNEHLTDSGFLCTNTPSIADLNCYADIAFADICEIDVTARPNISRWAGEIEQLPGFAQPFELLEMKDAMIIGDERT